MAKKIYSSEAGIRFTFPVVVSGKAVWVSLTGDEGEYETADEAVQAAIEATEKFKSGYITCRSEDAAVQDTPPDTPTGDVKDVKTEKAVFPEVTDLNGAVDILSSDPYRVLKMNLRTPGAIRAAMDRHGVEFPNFNLPDGER